MTRRIRRQRHRRRGGSEADHETRSDEYSDEYDVYEPDAEDSDLEDGNLEDGDLEDGDVEDSDFGDDGIEDSDSTEPDTTVPESTEEGYGYASRYPRYDDAEFETEYVAGLESADEFGAEDDEDDGDDADDGEDRPWYGRGESSGPGRITVEFVAEEDRLAGAAVEEDAVEANTGEEDVNVGEVDVDVANAEEANAVGIASRGEAEELGATEMEDTAVDPARHVEPERRPQTDGAPMVERPRVPPEDPDNPEAFGRWLRSQRELRGIQLRAIAESSKISLGYLRALESGRFDVLPAEVFTKGFLRQYSGYVGLDPEEAINFYLAARDHVEEVELDPLLIPTPPEKSSSGVRWMVAVLVVAALLLGVVWLLGRLAEQREAGADAAEDAPRSAVTRPEDAAPEDAASDSSSGTDTAHTDSESTDSASAVRGSSESPAPVSSPSSAVTEPAQASPLRVVLDFSDTCWVSAVIDEGETREKVHAQGESLTLDASRSIDLKVGNYRAVDVEVNGMPYDLRSRGRSNTVVRTVRIDLTSLDSAAEAAAASETVPGAAD